MAVDFSSIAFNLEWGMPIVYSLESNAFHNIQDGRRDRTIIDFSFHAKGKAGKSPTIERSYRKEVLLAALLADYALASRRRRSYV